MRATLMYGAGDVRVETVPNPTIQEPTDAIVRILAGCICGSHLWPYASKPETLRRRPDGPRIRRHRRKTRLRGDRPDRG